MERQDVLTALSNHVGVKNGISARALATHITGEATPAAERRLRTLIVALRCEGVPICGRPTSGYYIASTSDEVIASCMWLRSRAMTSLITISRLTQIAVPELMGQISLELEKAS
ncbi:MAG TPA: hypothetical protein DCS05_09910 [Nitrospiraceae bacterium]|nr:hypothetical protein [Nitrospiraceae bacterium]